MSTATIVNLDAKLPEVELPERVHSYTIGNRPNPPKQHMQRTPRSVRNRSRSQDAVMDANRKQIKEWAEVYGDSADYYSDLRKETGDKTTGAVEAAMSGILRGAERAEYPVAFLYQRLTHLKLMAGELEDVLKDIAHQSGKGAEQ